MTATEERIQSLEQRIQTLSGALEKSRADTRRAQLDMVRAEHALAMSEKHASLTAQRKAERRAQRAEGALERLVTLLAEEQAAIRLSDASAMNAAKRIAGYTLPEPHPGQKCSFAGCDICYGDECG